MGLKSTFSVAEWPSSPFAAAVSEIEGGDRGVYQFEDERSLRGDGKRGSGVAQASSLVFPRHNRKTPRKFA